MAAPAPQWPQQRKLTELTRSLNGSAIAALAARKTADAVVFATHSAGYVASILDAIEQWEFKYPDIKPQKREALVEGIVANSIAGEKIEQQVEALQSCAESTSDLRTVRDALAGYVAQLNRSGLDALPAFETLRPVLQEFEVKVEDAELRDSGYPQGLSEIDLAILRTLNSDSWTVNFHVALVEGKIASEIGWSPAAVSAAIGPLGHGGFITIWDPSGLHVARICSLTQKGRNAVVRTAQPKQPPGIAIA
jgi:hypothetical protein